VIDRLKTNSYMHAMRSRLYRDVRNRFIRAQKAEVEASPFNKLFEDRSGFVFKCVWCGSPMQVCAAPSEHVRVDAERN
jgi:hypothetical protein